MSRGDVPTVMSEVLGRPIEAAAPDFATWMAQAELPYDEHQTEEFKAMYDYYDRHGLLGNALTLRTILGCEPRSIQQFIELVAGSEVTAG